VAWTFLQFKDVVKYEYDAGRYRVFENIIPFIKDDVSLTHANNEPVIAALIYNFIISSIHLENNKVEKLVNIDVVKIFDTVWKNLYEFLYQIGEKFKTAGMKPFTDLYKEIKEKKVNNRNEAFNYLKSKGMDYTNTGWYGHAMLLCFFFLKNIGLYSSVNCPFDEIMLSVCDLGGDTDTNAAILGGVLGAGVGFRGLPKNRVMEMLKCVIANVGGGKKDGKRGLYSPGWILFVIEDMYNSAKARSVILEKKIGDFNDYKTKYMNMDFEKVTDEMMDLDIRKSKDYNNEMFGILKVQDQDYTVKFAEIVLNLLLK